MVKQNIELGQRIRDEVFQGNNYSQLGHLMEGIKAITILINPDATPEEITWANEKILELEKIEQQINLIKGGSQ